MPSHANQASATISATTSSARTAYPNPSNFNGVGVYNSGTVVVFVKSGDSSVAATTSDQFVAPGEAVEFKRNSQDTHLAAITGSGTATVYFSAAQVIE